MKTLISILKISVYGLIILLLAVLPTTYAQSEEPEAIDSDSCVDCHEFSSLNTLIQGDLSHSIHSDLECQDCHTDKLKVPHTVDPNFRVSSAGCRSCHEDESDEYQMHGPMRIGDSRDIPTCASCHGAHDILSPDNRNSKVHSSKLPGTCINCHGDLDLIKKYDLLKDHPVKLYRNSVHGKVSTGGIYEAASCVDCHSTNATSHKIYSPNNPESAIHHFNIPATCGKCHQGVAKDYRDGIHGQLVAEGNLDAPVCTDCHGEHGILSPSDPRSPVSKSKVAESTCSHCHGSTRLNEKYGLPSGNINTFIDNYHGLKSKSGDIKVANCASCHGVHRILPSSDPESRINPENLSSTCGECHPGISAKLAATPIHGKSGVPLLSPVAKLVQMIYFIAIFVIIGLMILHWLLDLFRQLQNVFSKPQVIRMRTNELLQHTFSMFSFTALTITGFSLKYDQFWLTKFLFGYEGGFEIRRQIHRIAAILFMVTIVWHGLYLIFSKRGKQFLLDMMPAIKDFKQFYQRIFYYLGIKKYGHPRFGRFSYVEKAEYWAIVWGAAIMVLSGLLLWFDNYFMTVLPRSIMQIALVVHYMEAWLAMLAILVWHLYSTIFSPDVYPMNPSWLTGKMPEEMYALEHPEDLEKVKNEMVG